MTPEMISQFFPLLAMVAVFYFLIIMPQRKKDKKFKEMLAGLSKGDDVVTIGGVEGKVISIKDDSVTIETGMDRVKLTYKKWAIKEVSQKEQA
jgi:preprotein translocase subunit YajC